MSDDLGIKLQNMFRTIYDAADLKYLRPLKRDMFRCAIDCLDDKNNVKEAEHCIDKCGQTLHSAMNAVQNEVTAFQGRIDRCLMNCQDDVRNERDESKARKLFDGCADKCLSQFMPMVPDVAKTMCEKLDKIKKEAKIH